MARETLMCLQEWQLKARRGDLGCFFFFFDQTSCHTLIWEWVCLFLAGLFDSCVIFGGCRSDSPAVRLQRWSIIKDWEVDLSLDCSDTFVLQPGEWGRKWHQTWLHTLHHDAFSHMIIRKPEEETSNESDSCDSSNALMFFMSIHFRDTTTEGRHKLLEQRIYFFLSVEGH